MDRDNKIITNKLKDFRKINRKFKIKDKVITEDFLKLNINNSIQTNNFSLIIIFNNSTKINFSQQFQHKDKIIKNIKQETQ